MEDRQPKLEDMKVPFSVQFEAVKIISSHSVPILIGKDLDTVQLEGTGVYFRKESKYFLATAHHVVKGKNLNEILILKKYGSASSISFKALKAINNDIADIAIFELEEPLTLFSPIEYEKICEIKDSSNYIYLNGFPCSKVSRKSKTEIEFEQRFVLTKILKDGEKYFKSFDERTNFVCDFKKKNVLLGNGTVATFPNPNGMSGGGAYEALYSKDNEFLWYNLIGIMTDWNATKKKYIRCTRSTVLKFLLEQGGFT